LLLGPLPPHAAATNGAAPATAAAAGEDMDISPTAASAPGPALSASVTDPALWGPGQHQGAAGADGWAGLWPTITPGPAVEGAEGAVRACQQECEAVRQQLAEAEDTLRNMRQELDNMER
jgi:hypothetical protein